MGGARRWIGALALFAVAMVVIVVARGRVSPPARPPLTLQFWHWSDPRRLAPEEEAGLAALPVDALCWWCGSIELVDGRARLRARGGPIEGAPGVARWAVVRIEPACVQLLDGGGDGLAAEVAEAHRRASTRGAVAGLQIDWDVPSRQLADYAAFLRALRGRLPLGAGLSCTALLAWLDQPAARAVAGAVDWWVPQCYSAALPADPATARVLVAADPREAVARCEAIGRPYRIGLPTFEQATLWDGDARLIAAALPIPLEEALGAGLLGEARPEALERLVLLRAPREVAIAGRRIPVGGTLLIGEPTVASLAAGIAAVRRAAGPWCRGISLFRLGAPGDMPCLDPRQARAAWEGEPGAAPSVEAAWEGSAGAWTLSLRDPATADLVALDRPVRLAVAWTGELPSAPPPLRVAPAIDGTPVAEAHATGFVVLVPFLRAGATIRLSPIAGAATAPPGCRLATSTDPDQP